VWGYFNSFRLARASQAIFDTHHYIEPCDHRCFHGRNSHGSRSGIQFSEEDEVPLRDRAELIHHWTSQGIVQLCLTALQQADLVFASIETQDAYGTIAELGYARSLNKRVVVATPEAQPDLWFVYGLAREEDRLVNQLSARAALEQALYGDEQQRRTESPVEAKFYMAARNCVNLTPQVEIGPYWVDFALLDQKVAIEIDGHEYHKTREQRTYDAQRQRHLEKLGWRVIRFTGTEIQWNAKHCVEDVLVLLR
jgi:very-short-patch-repair endonuclease